jgi:hypothetical protein
MRLDLWEKIQECILEYGPLRFRDDGLGKICLYTEHTSIFVHFSVSYGENYHMIYHYQNGMQHREAGPAFESWENNILRQSHYFHKDLLHRPKEKGPAASIFNRNGVCTSKRYYQYGIEIYPDYLEKDSV